MSIISYTAGNFPTYRFYISTASTASYEVFPLNFLDTSLIDSLEENNIFYRRKFTGTLLFGTNSTAINAGGAVVNRYTDWLFFWAIEQTTPCERLYFTITRTVTGVTSTYWEGYFATSNGTFDIDKCTFEVEPLANDEYDAILNLVDIQYNILDIPAASTINAFILGTSVDKLYTHARWLSRAGFDNILETLAENISPGVTFSSHFFTDATNPITGDDNLLLYLTLSQKSDIKYPTALFPATTAMMSWNQLMDILWGMFQVLWNYDLATDTINVEHISWFPHNAGMDFRTQLSTHATNKYSYMKEVMPKYEKFTMQDSSDSNFVGTPIWYDSDCVDSNSRTNTKETTINISTDLKNIIDNPDSISDTGFVMLASELVAGVFWVINDFGKIDNTSFLPNMPLSWSHLHDAYFRDNRVLIEGYLNNNLITFWTSKKVKSQECSIILCDDYDPSEEITTELGEDYFGGEKGRVVTGELYPSGESKFTLAYGPDDNVNTGVDNQINVWGLLSMEPAMDEFTLEFTFNTAFLADTDIRVREFIYDDLGALHDTGGWETITFHINDLTTSFTHGCHVLAAGWTIQIEIEYTAVEIDYILGSPATESYTPPFIYTAI